MYVGTHNVVLNRVSLVPAAGHAGKYRVLIQSMRSHPTIEPRLHNFEHYLSSNFLQSFDSKIQPEHTINLHIKRAESI